MRVQLSQRYARHALRIVRRVSRRIALRHSAVTSASYRRSLRNAVTAYRDLALARRSRVELYAAARLNDGGTRGVLAGYNGPDIGTLCFTSVPEAFAISPFGWQMCYSTLIADNT
jgi:hypothetical protein